MDERAKRLLMQYGILSGIVTVMFAVLFASVLLTRGRWYSGLADAVQYVLSKDPRSQYKVAEPLVLDSVLSVSSAVFSLDDSADVAVIVRVPTMYGPYPGVFVYDGARAEFKGFACLSGVVQEQFTGAMPDVRIEYWSRQAAKIARAVRKEDSDEGQR